jgi:SAM-dependent methyltransferase
MGSPSDSFKRWFRGAGSSQSRSEEKSASPARVSRRSTALGEFMRGLKPQGEEKLHVLDLGPTSPNNIAFLTELGTRVYNEDVLRASQDTSYRVAGEAGAEQFDEARFFADNLAYGPDHFDAVLFWDTLEFLPEPLVVPLVDRIQTMVKPQGTLLAFFHTKDAGPESSGYRYHIVEPDTVQLESRPGIRLQRVFQNRHIENLFKNFASRKFFLGRDNIREVILVR